MSVAGIIRHRRDTAANWATNNPVLQAGQLGFETNTGLCKFGNGTTAWNSLAYACLETSAQILAKLVAGGDATVTPAASKIPVAGGDGKIDDGWLPLTQTGKNFTSHVQSTAYCGGTEGSGSTNTNVGIIAYPDGGDYSNNSNPSTGAIQITLPQSWVSTMLKITVSIFDRSVGESFDVHCGGWLPAADSAWHSTMYAYILGQAARNFTVRFGHTGTKACIYIGELTDTWHFLKATITEVQIGYNNNTFAQWSSGWAIRLEATAFSSITRTVSNCQIGLYHAGNLIWNAGNDGPGSGLDADTLDGAQLSALVQLGGALGTPSSGVATNLTGTAAGLTAGDSNQLQGNAASAFATAGHDHDGDYEALGAVATHAAASDPHAGTLVRQPTSGTRNNSAPSGDFIWHSLTASIEQAANLIEYKNAISTLVTWLAAGAYWATTRTPVADDDLTRKGYVDTKQPLDATLTALAAIATATDKVIYATGSDAFATADFTAVGRAIVAATSKQIACQKVGGWWIAGQSSVQASVGAVTTEVVLASILIPASAMGANGRIRVTALWGCNSNANTKQFRIYHNTSAAVGGTMIQSQGVTTALFGTFVADIGNQNDEASQRYRSGVVFAGTGSTANGTATLDTNSASYIVITGQKVTDAGDTVTLDQYLVEVYFEA